MVYLYMYMYLYNVHVHVLGVIVHAIFVYVHVHWEAVRGAYICIHVLCVHGVLLHAVPILCTRLTLHVHVYFTFHVRKLAYPQSFSFAVNQWNISRKKFNFKNILWLNGNSSTCKYYNMYMNTILMDSGINSATHQLNNKIPVHCILRKRWIPYDCFMVTNLIIADSSNVSYWVVKLEKCNSS